MAALDRLPIAPRIEDEAAAWVARHDTGPLAGADAVAFKAWIAASPAHEEAFRTYTHLWAEFDDLSSAPVAPAKVEAANDRGFWLSRRAVAGAAAILLTVGATFATLSFNADPRFETEVGEQRVVTLADGSRITLNTDTAISAELGPDQRVIALDRGEALFEVAHDAARPFIVQSPTGDVRAVGTKFVVSVGRDDLKVVVTEGKVLVDAKRRNGQASEARPIALVAGQQLSGNGPKVAVARRVPEQLARDLAWRQGDIIFEGEGLAAAAAEMQRYTSRKIIVDPGVAHYSVGGYFRSNDIDAFVETIEALFPVRVVRSGDEIRLTAKG
ncbi:FecR family protein [Sphingosinicella rhizophila]|uniref:FecR domain-containing protein n=1 Tax=Sphingosinicella rhizophila TaxID=3050082 RepID=A0ABU3QCD2_9SPHN|nr:FecR domain-containing protein [Sphingosinicella sp. GR2756]MDT9600628.1 FecR domain-containing protein [Sphingosinicella sp. GR2756]